MTSDTLTGAQFRREVGTDPQLWAREFLVAYEAAPYDAVRTAADREAFVTQWFRDAMNAVAQDMMDTIKQSLADPAALLHDTDPGMRA